MKNDDLGSMEVEAAKLLRALRERLATDVHDAESACCVCPVCRIVDATRELDTEKLASQATVFVAGFMDALTTDFGAEPEQPSSRVEHINISEQVDIADETA